jgi:DNA modification methylase
MSDRLTILQGDCLEVLRGLPDESVHCCVTSPPYWGLRDYGVAGQIGLERTPEEYVAKMVAVFAEVRRVLRGDGTCWVNLGDSYANDTKWGGSSAGGLNGGFAAAAEAIGQRAKRNTGLKPKDLCGIPWAVAKALQSPQYTGRIKDVHDRIWLAAMIDGEGCMFIHKRKAGQNNGQGYARKSDCYGAGLEVANTHESIVQRCLAITGMGSICFQDKESRMKNRNQRLYRWNLRSNQCREVIREIYPFLVGKQHEARLVLGCPPSGPDAEKAHSSLISLHNGFDACIDFPAPAPCFVPGWYLRSDIIWSKANPMPESVTDRPTKSHEYIFLLSKSERYWYDAEAIREAAIATSPSGHVKPCDEDGDPRFRTRAGLLAYAKKTRGKWSKEDPQSSGHRIVENVARARANGASHDAPFGDTRNKRTVWTVPTSPYSDAHFATFPPDLIKPCIMAGCPIQACALCGAPWERVMEKGELVSTDGTSHDYRPSKASDDPKIKGRSEGWTPNHFRESKTVGWQPTCECGCAEATAGTVLDPFGGSGTTGMVALELGRRAILIELNPEYVEMQRQRCDVTLGLAL